MTSQHTVAIVGARGRMGQVLMRLSSNSFARAIPLDQGDDLGAGIQQADVIIEFAHHTATPQVCQHAEQFKKPLVIGTTGHTAEEKQTIYRLASILPVVYSANFSVGVNLLFYLTEIAAKVLKNKGYDCEIIEMHHRQKVDAPSGTARKLLDILLKINELPPEAVSHGREGEVGVRPTNQVGVHALRGGDIVGEHTVMFAATGERLELTHKASSREIFASGALYAAQWALEKWQTMKAQSNTAQARLNRPYDMQDVLGLSES
ncbi:MAG: 4-hydroxy-tetrahydrodipicolinate reductase [Methylacidiphilales bacterium]|nr:4-hydroxy-tetrahydrodipicolinate reductase [Candidatus Methylacidiphilales bacterium]MDW8348867.1 4-hydroxy-tetrahydrodipicolinate reductase [Verrucomicrobiae bacterium]